MRGDFCRFLQTLAATGCGHVFQVLSAVTHWVAEITSCPLATSGQCIINSIEKGKYHSLSYTIETAKVIVSHDTIFTEKKYIFKQYCNMEEG